MSLYEENRLQHVELSRCTSKEQEVLNSSQREDKHVAIDASGAVRIRDKEHKMEADLSSDMFVRLALMRRGLAFDQANLLDYLEHDGGLKKSLTVESQVNQTDMPKLACSRLSTQTGSCL